MWSSFSGRQIETCQNHTTVGFVGKASSDSEEVGDVTALWERSLGIILSSSKLVLVNFSTFPLSHLEFLLHIGWLMTFSLRFVRLLQHEITCGQFAFNSSVVFTSWRLGSHYVTEWPWVAHTSSILGYLFSFIIWCPLWRICYTSKSVEAQISDHLYQRLAEVSLK